MKATTPITSHVNDLRFTFNGKVYGLHHSNADLIPGEDKLSPSGAITAKQTTAGDSTKGYSYFWDASNIEAVENSVNNQAGARNIYLVEASSVDDVLPDINVPFTSARAIKGEMSILDKVSLPTDIGTGRDARMQVLEMLKKHGINPETTARGKSIDAAYFMARGEKALEEYLPARFMLQAENMIESFNFNDPANLPPAYKQGAMMHNLYETYLDGGTKGLADKLLEQRGMRILNPNTNKAFQHGRELGVLHGPNSIISPSEIDISALQKYADSVKSTESSMGLRVEPLPDPTKKIIKARIAANRSRVAAQEAAGKGFKKAMGSSSLVQAAQDAAQAVVNRDSAAMKVAGAAATIFRRRI